MFLHGILSISGHAGLFRLVSQGKSSIIVESLEEKKRMPAYASSKISALEDIAVFTEDKEVPLSQVFKSIYDKENGGPIVLPKNTDEEIKKYFIAALPDYDKNRVYVSDMKKIISWYNLLHKHELLKFEEEKTEEVAAEK